MAHVRQQIRDHVAAILTPGAIYGDRVFKMRSYPLSEKIANAVCIYTTRATYQRETMAASPAGRIYRAQQTVVVEAFHSGPSTSVFDDIDALSAEIEQKVLDDPTFGGKVKDVILTSAEQDVNTDGGVAIASIALEFVVSYRFSPANPEVSIP
jgi:hypothetical protein